ncbi:NADPH-dependent FMN reductase [Chengkuizengella axinellae]|uniref:NADPH-dependent FMN reductase n=1 Tax=Chengkuizengella axinellae TaxID=3064388 RepID=A0ABT9J4H3_9BACL|nr:NADPH-dependent FMN reductase [Chengkuizengella sp. 2205SS18-9]MDP5276514.1 NADPH-dependent FMN reductase [Chengkuizengella sp. 2205SS18-9]
MSTEQINVLGFAGSLRKDSYNRALLREAIQLSPEGLKITDFDLSEIPMFNEDVEKEGDPAAVTAFKNAIRESKALLIVTPEYNSAIPGVLKNALDWASRGAKEAPLLKKPIAIMGATPGRAGTAQAQAQLRQTLVTTRSLVMVEPQVLISEVHRKFDDQGNFTDEKTGQYIGRLLTSLQEWVNKLKS